MKVDKTILPGDVPGQEPAARVPDEAATGRHAAVRYIPWIRPIRAEDLAALKAAAAADQHQVILPTHVIVTNSEGKEEIVGYLSFQSVCLINTWVDSRRLRARESVHLLNTAENLAALNGAKLLLTPCAGQSPFRPYMAGLGYQFAGDTGMFLKPI